jgi:hypothetical protein
MKTLVEMLCRDFEKLEIAQEVERLSLQQLTQIFLEIAPNDVGENSISFAKNLRELVSVNRVNIVQRWVDSADSCDLSVPEFVNANSTLFIHFFDLHELSSTRNNDDWNEVVLAWWDTFWEPLNSPERAIAHHKCIVKALWEIAERCNSELCIESAFLGLDYSAVVVKEDVVNALRALSKVNKLRDRALHRISWIEPTSLA